MSYTPRETAMDAKQRLFTRYSPLALLVMAMFGGVFAAQAITTQQASQTRIHGRAPELVSGEIVIAAPAYPNNPLVEGVNTIPSLDLTPNDYSLFMGSVVGEDKDGDGGFSVLPKDGEFTLDWEYKDLTSGSEVIRPLTAEQLALPFTETFPGEKLQVTAYAELEISTITGLPNRSTDNKLIDAVYEIQVPKREAVLIVNSARFPMGSNFPQNGFVGASFIMQTEFRAGLYSWSSDAVSKGWISIDEQTGEITLLAKPDDNATITITATPKVNNIGAVTQTHSFTLKHWWATSTELGASVTNNWANAAQFCLDQTGYRLPVLAQMTSANAVGSLPPAARYPNGRDNNGLLWNEWGNIGNVPGWQDVAYWTSDLNQAQRLTVNMLDGQVGANAVDNTINFACVTGINDEAQNELVAPSISQLHLQGQFQEGGELTATYTFNPNGGNTTDYSVYKWGEQGQTSAGFNVSSLRVTKRDNAGSGQSTVPKRAIAAADIGKVIELSVQARNGVEVIGNTLTVDTAMPQPGVLADAAGIGSFVQYPETLLVNGAQFPIGSPFPRNGFNGANFVMQLRYHPSNYNWAVESADTDVVSVDATGKVSMSGELQKIANVTVKAAPKNGVINTTGTKLQQSFTLDRWWKNSPIVDTYDPQRCADLGVGYQFPPDIPVARAAVRDPITNSMNLAPTMTTSSMLGYQAGSVNPVIAKREVNGVLWNEWGDLFSYPGLIDLSNSLPYSFTQPLDLTKVKNSSVIVAGIREGFLSFVSIGEIANSLCYKNFMPINQDKPVIRNLKLQGDFVLGARLKVTYDLINTNISPISSFIDQSRYKFGVKGVITDPSETDGTVVPFDRAVNGITLPALTAQQINQVLEFAVIPIVRNYYPTQVASTGDIARVDTNMSSAQGNLVNKNGKVGQLVINNQTYPLGSEIPTNGFAGANFVIQLPFAANQYNWAITPISANNFVRIESDTGKIWLTAEPSAIMPVTITATAKANTPADFSTTKVFSHTFTLKNWWINGAAVGKPASYSWSEAYQICADVPNYRLPTYADMTFARPVNGVGSTSRSTSAQLWNQWGSMASFNNGWKAGNYWATDSFNSDFHTVNLANGDLNFASNTTLNNVACVHTLDTEQTANKVSPVISNLTLKGTFAAGAKLSATYKFTQAGSLGDFSAYAWGELGTTREAVRAGLTRVVFRNNISALGVVPEYTIQPQDMGKIIELSVEAISIDNLKGNVLTVDTSMPQIVEGQPDVSNLVEYPVGITVNGATFPLVSVSNGNGFPTTGFLGGAFQINSKFSANNYIWQSSNQVASVDENGKVVLTNIPTATTRNVVITARPKPGINATELSHTFTIKSWWQTTRELGLPPSANYSLANSLCTSLGGGYKLPQLNMLLANNNTRATGALWNEWGNINVFASKAWGQGNYWSTSTASSNTRQALKLADGTVSNVSESDTTTQAVCMRDNFDNQLSSKPNIDNLTLTGFFDVGSQLAATYEFTPGEGSQIDVSAYEWGKQGTTAAKVNTTNNRVTARINLPQSMTIGVVPPSPQLGEDDIGTVYELSVQARNGANAVGNTLTADTSMRLTQNLNTFTLKNEVEFPETVIINRSSFVINDLQGDLIGDNIPNNAFTGGSLKIQFGYASSNYDWRLTGDGLNSDNAVIDNQGVITFGEKPFLGNITVTASPKEGVDIITGSRLSHSFDIKHWWLLNNQISGGSNKTNWSDANQRCLASQSQLAQHALLSDAPIALDSTTNPQTATRTANGLLFNEWGSLDAYSNWRNVSQSEFWLAPAAQQDPNAILGGVMNGQKRAVTLVDSYPVVCVINAGRLNDVIIPVAPRITDLKISGYFEVGSLLNATYYFDPVITLPSESTDYYDISSYLWGNIGETRDRVANSLQRVVTHPVKGLTLGVVPPYRVVATDIGTVKELSVMARAMSGNVAGLTAWGNILTIDTAAEQRLGNLITQPEGLVANGYRFTPDSGFPRNVFSGAEIKLQTQLPLKNYEVNISGAGSSAVSFNNNTGAIIFNRAPAGNITVVATPKAEAKLPGSTNERPNTLTIVLNPSRWWNNYGQSTDNFAQTEAQCVNQTPNAFLPTLALFGKDAVRESSDNASLRAEWGDVTTLQQANWVNGNAQYWTNDARAEDSFRMSLNISNGIISMNEDPFRSQQSTIKRYQACVRSLKGEQILGSPYISDLSLSGVFDTNNPTGLTATYTYNRNGAGADQSRYIWSTLNDATQSPLNNMTGATPVSSSGVVPPRSITQGDIGKVIALTVQAVDNSSTPRIGNLLTVNTAQVQKAGESTFNMVTYPKQVVVNGANYPLNSSLDNTASAFPTLGFKGGSFKVQSEFVPNNYDWSIEGANIAAVNENGVVTLTDILLNDINVAVTVKATPKSEAVVNATSINHTFTLQGWFATANHLGSELIKRNQPDSLSFCNSNNYSLAAAVKFKNGESRTANGGLWNQWGDRRVELGIDSNVWSSANGRSIDLTNGTQANTAATTALTTLCYQDIATPPSLGFGPIVNNLVLEGVFIKGNSLRGSYLFNPNGGTVVDKSAYLWAKSRDNAFPRIDSLPLNAPSDEVSGIIATSGVVPEYTITEEDIGKVLVLLVQARNGDGAKGNTLLVDTSMTRESGNLVTAPFYKIVTHLAPISDNGYITWNLKGEFDVVSGFPKTGFKGATFTLYAENDLAKNSDYIWSWEGSSDTSLINVDNGIVTFTGTFPSPSPLISVKAKHKFTGLVRGYEFKVQNWFDYVHVSNISTYTNQNNSCETQFGTGYVIPYYLDMMKPLPIPKIISWLYPLDRTVGTFWGEWGDFTAYTSKKYLPNGTLINFARVVVPPQPGSVAFTGYSSMNMTAGKIWGRPNSQETDYTQMLICSKTL